MAMLLGKKIGMTQVYAESGELLPVTVIQAGPCVVMQVKTTETDGYNAVQLGFEDVKPSRRKNPQLGSARKANTVPKKFVREMRLPDEVEPECKPGESLTVSVFAGCKFVDVVGTSKGKGFAGGIKRHGFRRQPKTHGQSDRTRAPGSRGATTTPGRVFKGSRGPGHMGSHRVTAQNLRVEFVDPERNLIGLRGSVPGPRGNVVVIKEARKQ